ncbi:MAG: hypothetical protein P8076_05990 [Gammaproteobacteria bacterium]
MSGRKIAAVAAVVAIAAAAAFGVKLYQNRDAAQRADAFLQHTLGKLGDTHYQSASRSMSGVLTIHGLTLKPKGRPNEYRIGELVVHRYDNQHRTPNFAHIEARGVKLDMSSLPDPRAALFLGMMGYQNLTADVEVNYNYKPAAKTVSVAFREDVKDMGELKLDLDLNNVAVEQALFTYPAIELKRAQVTYRDESLIKRLLKMAAAQSGVSEKDLIARIQGQLDQKMAQTKTRLEAKALTEVKHFLDNRGSLTVSVEPSQPVRLAELKGLAPDTAAERLNIHVTSY